MKNNLIVLLLVAHSAMPAVSAETISAASILARTKILSSDAFEGRGPGSPAEEKTVGYLIEEFKRLGLEPGNPNGTYFQEVPLVGITSRPTLSFNAGGTLVPMTPINDYVGPTSRVTPHLEVKDSDVVFVGYGIVAPEFGWDDFKGVDVRGKTIVVLVNDPPVVDSATGKLDPKIFGGAAMTYYGRWTYKYEIAAERGAAACLIVHETGPAAYPFAVVINSRSRENFEIRSPDGNAGHVAMEGWLTLDATKRLFAASGKDFDALKRDALRRDFQPVALGARASFTIDSELRNVDSKNVVVKLPGTDPKRRDEHVIYTAHWDHLGRDPKLSGDQIYNGAADNAAGVAVLLELAQAFKALPASQQPKRSVLFLSVTAEEKGLLGSRYYAQNPLHPLSRTLAAINMDGANQFGRTSDMATIGFGASTLDDIGSAVAKSQGRDMHAEEHPERGSYYRSDHFEFAKVGVPAYYPKSGKRFVGKLADFGEKLVEDYIANHYHKVSDEVRPDWTFEGAAQDTEFLLQVGLRVADGDTWPEWKPGNEFKARRDAMMKPSPK
ncbi:MAG TPA: M28 family metallopeptidase [Opitutaceae bacterium]|nr:M28 family metallopeptidase [Opitutaceae bacterium]